jgi:hypothetical protein
MPNVLRRAAVAFAAAACTVAVSMPAANASSAKAAAAECDGTQVVYAVHGIGQGPTVSHPNIKQSPTLYDFQQDLKKYDSDAQVIPILYPAASSFNVGATWDTYVNDGERNLQPKITSHVNATCPQWRAKSVSLVGYSMGAWVINKWLNDHKSEWNLIDTVVLYGDPCWTSPGDNEGVTRLFLNNYGCMPGKYYPQPAAQVPFKVKTFSLGKDPVSGDGFRAGGNRLVPTVNARRNHQLAALIGCHGSCSHLQYQTGKSGGWMVDNGAWLVGTRFLALDD